MGKKNKLKTSDTLIPSSFVSVGATLTRQREKLGLSAEECANALKISLGKLADLESNNYSSYSSEIFVRGHLKNYAKLVGLPTSEVIAIYNEGNPVQDAPVEPAMPIGMEVKSRWWLPYSIMFGVLLIWLAIYQAMDDVDGLSEQASDPTDIASDNGPVVPVTSSNTQQEALANTIEAPSNADSIKQPAITQVNVFPAQVQIPSNTEDVLVDIPLLASTVPAAELMKSANATEVDTPVATVNTIAEPSDSLRFVFSEDCWLEVRNQAGKVVKSGLQRKGTSLSLEGEGPFNITLGNAKGASLVFNNEPVVLAANRKLLRVVVGG